MNISFVGICHLSESSHMIAAERAFDDDGFDVAIRAGLAEEAEFLVPFL